MKKTITTIFIIPTLSIDRDDLKYNGFINGYISDERRDVQYKDAVYLLFKPEDLDRFRDFLENENAKNQGILDDYDYENGYVVLVYKLNPKWKKDFLLVREGLYSKTSKKFQESFPKTITVKRGKQAAKQEATLQHRVFKKSEELRSYWEDKIDMKFTEEMEVWEGFHMENETLNLDKLKQEETA